MNKFFVAEHSYGQRCGEWGDVYIPAYPAVTLPISFMSYGHACSLAEKLGGKEVIHCENGDMEVIHQYGVVYAVNVPDNWNGEDVALWLDSAISNGECDSYQP